MKNTSSRQKTNVLVVAVICVVVLAISLNLLHYNLFGPSRGQRINMTEAVAIAQNYVSQLGDPNLGVKEVEEYTQNFYFQVYEKSTNIGAFEMLIDPYTGEVTPEEGPNMMWNTKYGMMSTGMIGGYKEAPMTVNATQAMGYAQYWLNSNVPGATVGEVFPFYGYYHVMIEVNGSNYGMMSVNGYTGHVWYHYWHGKFIQEVELVS